MMIEKVIDFDGRLPNVFVTAVALCSLFVVINITIVINLTFFFVRRSAERFLNQMQR